jgi:hypothetical protein
MKKLPPKSAAGGKVVQPVDAAKVYTLNTGKKVRGKKIIVYAQSGMGKTTAACMTPDPVFVATDDGIDEIVHPQTGEVVPSYKASTYQDLRNILAQPKLFGAFKTIVLDNMTEAENLAVPFILSTMTRDGQHVKSLEGYGWGSGYAHLADHDNYIKYDLQRLADLGFNVVVICQTAPRKETSAEVPDYLKDGPKLVWRPMNKAFAVTDFVEWSDFCFRIGYSTLAVSNKRASSSGQRVFFVSPETHFEAKARGFPPDIKCVSFDSPADDSIWKFTFDHAWPQEETA